MSQHSQHATKRLHRSENVALLTDILWPVGPPCGPMIGRTCVNPCLIWRLNDVNMQSNKVNWCRDISGDDKTTEWCLFLQSIHMTSACWVCPVYLLYIQTQHTSTYPITFIYTLLYDYITFYIRPTVSKQDTKFHNCRIVTDIQSVKELYKSITQYLAVTFKTCWLTLLGHYVKYVVLLLMLLLLLLILLSCSKRERGRGWKERRLRAGCTKYN